MEWFSLLPLQRKIENLSLPRCGLCDFTPPKHPFHLPQLTLNQSLQSLLFFYSIHSLYSLLISVELFNLYCWLVWFFNNWMSLFVFIYLLIKGRREEGVCCFIGLFTHNQTPGMIESISINGGAMKRKQTLPFSSPELNKLTFFWIHWSPQNKSTKKLIINLFGEMWLLALCGLFCFFFFNK